MKVTQSCPTLCNPIDYTVHGILQARILEWVAYPFSRGSSWPRNQTRVSYITGRLFTSWVTREVNKLCPTLWDPMDCSMTGFPDFRYLLEFAQILSIELVMLFIHLILCYPSLLLPSIVLCVACLYSEKTTAPHSSTVAWKIPWMEEPGRLQSMGSLRVGHDWVTSLSLFTFMHWRR